MLDSMLITKICVVPYRKKKTTKFSINRKTRKAFECIWVAQKKKQQKKKDLIKRLYDGFAFVSCCRWWSWNYGVCVAVRLVNLSYWFMVLVLKIVPSHCVLSFGYSEHYHFQQCVWVLLYWFDSCSLLSLSVFSFDSLSLTHFLSLKISFCLSILMESKCYNNGIHAHLFQLIWGGRACFLYCPVLLCYLSGVHSGEKNLRNKFALIYAVNS